VKSYKTIDILIPCYNCSKYINKCINSVVNQTYPLDKIHIVCIDDGSKDDTWNKLQTLQNKYKNIMEIHKQENKGSLETRFELMKYNSSEYFIQIDSDDYINKNALKWYNNKLQKKDYDMLQSWYVEVRNNKIYKIKKIKKGSWEDIQKYGASLATSIINSKFWRKCNIVNPRCITNGEDAYIYHSLLIRTNNVGLIKKLTYYYCINNESVSCFRKKFVDDKYMKEIWKLVNTFLVNYFKEYKWTNFSNKQKKRLVLVYIRLLFIFNFYFKPGDDRKYLLQNFIKQINSCLNNYKGFKQYLKDDYSKNETITKYIKF